MGTNKTYKFIIRMDLKFKNNLRAMSKRRKLDMSKYIRELILADIANIENIDGNIDVYTTIFHLEKELMNLHLNFGSKEYARENSIALRYANIFLRGRDA